jgi:uncharacterized protein (TIGR03118 family)
MLLHRLTQYLGGRRRFRRPSPPRSPGRRLYLEPLEDRFVPSSYAQVNLAADQPGVAQAHDPNLVDAWGISLNPNGGNFWLSARATGTSPLYNGDFTRADGTRVPFAINPPLPVVAIPGGAPTGQVFSGSLTDFVVTSGTASQPARFIFASSTGHITGWNPTVPLPQPSRNAQTTTANNPDAVYTGLAISSMSGTGNFLYAADFKGGKIDVYNSTYTATSLAGDFVDPNIPAGYSPWNIWNLGGKLYVTYARQEDGDALPDGGSGFVSVFDLEGNFLQRLVSEGELNEPWGLARAPGNFGEFSNAVLVGNHGDGRINAYDATTGAFLGALRDPSGEVIEIDGLLGLHFGNGVTAGDTNALYFAARPDEGAHGLFGSLRVAPAQVDSVVVNDGSAQRSMVKSLTVTFSDVVVLGDGAFELRKADGSLVDLNVTTELVNGRTVAMITFAGAGIRGGSLADGNYELIIRSDAIEDTFGRALDGDGDGAAGGDRSEAFFRLFGDSDGDRDVDVHDLLKFVSALNSEAGDSQFLDYMDVNGDGRVALVDLLAFVSRLGTQLDP